MFTIKVVSDSVKHIFDNKMKYMTLGIDTL